MERAPSLAAVAIGRNEGERLIACLRSLDAAGIDRVVYVDSGSTDGSVPAARAAGAQVVALDMTQPFTAARARNAGMAALGDGPAFVMLIDGDCILEPGFIAEAFAAFAEHPRGVVVCGRRREQHPTASVYNALIDREWDTPVGAARACGGDALMRLDAVRSVGGFDPALIAGEEPDLCLRLIRAGGEVWRIDAEMTRHDAAITRFGQWWRRAERAGHAYAEGAVRHAAVRHWWGETRRAVLWGAALPVTIVVAALSHPAFWLAALAYPAQIVRLALRGGGGRLAWAGAALSVVTKFAETQGIARYWLNRARGRRAALIEYK
jgi:GT2 family glycosyltransferase